jgi:osmotically-inducible protein OsmY
MSFTLNCTYESQTACGNEDADLRHRVISFLKTWSTVEGNITVDVVQGVVKIQGRVGSFHDRWLLSGCCSHVAGVLRVEDNLIVDSNWKEEEALLPPEVPVLAKEK